MLSRTNKMKSGGCASPQAPTVTDCKTILCLAYHECYGKYRICYCFASILQSYTLHCNPRYSKFHSPSKTEIENWNNHNSTYICASYELYKVLSVSFSFQHNGQSTKVVPISFQRTVPCLIVRWICDKWFLSIVQGCHGY